MKDLVIAGAGGHGKDIRDIAEAAGYNFIGFLDDRKKGSDIIGTFKYLMTHDVAYSIGVNDSKTRAKIHDIYWAGLAKPETIVHPTALVSSDSLLQKGVVVGAYSVIGPGSMIGRHTHLNANTFVTRSVLQAFVTISPNATVCGDCYIGEKTMIGAGATVSNLRVVGSECKVGAGSVVIKDVHNGMVVVGVPARGIND